MKAVLDPNVIVSGLLSRNGVPAQLLRIWTEGGFELVCSRHLLDELQRVFTYPKIVKHLGIDDSRLVLEALRVEGTIRPDPDEPPAVQSVDPNDDYLIALAQATHSFLVSGDDDLLSLAGRIPVYSPRQFLTLLHPRS